MKLRDDRLRLIMRIIKENRISSQEGLLGELEKQGISVTQATLSRDLKLLKVGKVSDGWNGYYYTLPESDVPPDIQRTYIQDLQRGFLSLDFSGKIGVIKTLQGHADSVAFAIDRFNLDCILGTIAGDDTIFLVLKEENSPEDLINLLSSFMPDLEL
ncbi:arginine repressor [Marispirochaeta aestuarii]|uniref:Arginine repressor n=1 Tax=Marispirochaeta aestuarii TaxID=1963862 RepID=A0A1Y1RTL2_9SPIO|nr:ArgR family transcriptional regulator [Marispirochaeta aestuarii]ORC31130.1 ArgR family transcriptional regulator [Marispirochaeta aestuarii]